MAEKLFDPSVRGWHSAQIGAEHDAGWRVATSYLRAADALVEHMEADRMQPDLAFLPICFLYRHAAELTIKQLVLDTEALIRVGAALQEIEEQHVRDVAAVEKKLLKLGHRIDALLGHLQDRLRVVSAEPLPTEELDVLRELASFDETGERFRYSRVKTTTGLAPSFETAGHFDVLRLRTRLGAAIRFLQDGVGSWISDLHDSGAEMIAEFEREYGDR